MRTSNFPYTRIPVFDDIRASPEFTASLVSIGAVAWVRLDDDQVRFTIAPVEGTQVWAYVLSIMPLTLNSSIYIPI